jgi:transcriptional regulator with XRE-family HTH domain
MGNYKDSDRSRFATTLARLLDETDLFKREEWARVLDITPQAISHWVNDKAIPRAELLRRILDVLTNATGVPQDILREFYAVCREPATKVSPLHGDRMGKTVGHYLVTPVMQGFLRALNPLPPQQQEDVLYQASDLCWQLQVGDYNPPAAVMSRELSAPGLAGTVVCDSQHTSAPIGRVEDAEYLLDEEEDDAFTKTEVITGKTQAKMLHRYRGLSPVNSSNGNFGEVGKFDLKPQGRTLAGLSASYVVVLLHFRKGENVFSSFPLDEMMFFLLQGQVSWRFEGYDRTLSLGTRVGEPQLTWVGAAGRKGAPRGLPPFRVYSEGDESAVGLAVLYARTGVPLRELSTYQKDRKVELDGRDWTEGEVESYWKIAKKVLPHSGLPFVGRVPTELEEL